MDKQEERRKNYFIKREFQRKFILKFCSLLILASVISGAILYKFSSQTLTTAFIRSHLSIVSTSTYILPALVGSSLVAVILVSIATAFVIMFLSHKIAGPLFKIERSVQKAGLGDLTLDIKLRSGDEIEKMADCFNDMTQNLNKAVVRIKTEAENIDRQINAIAELGEKKNVSAKEIEVLLKGLAEKKKNLDMAIGYFKL